MGYSFGTKTVDKSFWKIMIFLLCLKFHFSFLKNILLYPEYEKKIFSGLFCPKNTNKKTFDFLTKTMDSPLWDISIFLTFLKPHLCGLKNDLFWLNSSKKRVLENVRFFENIMDYPVLKISIWWIFFNFSGLKSVLFHPEPQKTNFFLS